MKKPTWTEKVKCKFCHHKFTVTVDEVEYKDMKPDFYFIPDMQYVVTCPENSEILVMSALPTDVALWVQEKYNEEDVEGENN